MLGFSAGGKCCEESVKAKLGLELGKSWLQKGNTHIDQVDRDICMFQMWTVGILKNFFAVFLSFFFLCTF